MQKRSMNRWIGRILTAAFALTACTPDARSVTTTVATELPTSGEVASPKPDFSTYYGDRPPAAILIVGNREQTAGVGTSTWTVVAG